MPENQTISKPTDAEKPSGKGLDVTICSGSLKPFTHLGLDQYLIGACAEKKAVLTRQDKTAREESYITCGCGWHRWIGYAYRCLYCGEWYCAPCAETHFGQSIEAWTIEKRIAKRLEIQARISGQNEIAQTRAQISAERRVMATPPEPK